MVHQICVISDTHHNQTFIQKMLAQIPKVDTIIHLGDFYDDAICLLNLGIEIIRIPGVWCPDYSNKHVDNRLFVTYDDWHFFLTHTPNSHEYDLPNDPKPEKVLEKQDVDLFLYGHTHIPKISTNGKITLVNPGHLKSIWEKGYDPSYALISVQKNNLTIKIIDLTENKIIEEKTLTR